MKKVKLTDDLVKKAEKIFGDKEVIYTGEGLTRKELKRLYIAGIISRELVRLDNSQLIYQWRCNPIL